MATDEDDHSQLISTFIDSYISLKKTGNRRKVLVKFFDIEYNFDYFVHQMMKSLLTIVIPIDFAIPVIFNYLIEGQKSIFKCMYGFIKSNKDFILNLKTKDQLLQNIRSNTLKTVEIHMFLYHSFLGKKWSSSGSGSIINFDQNSKQEIEKKAKE